jgi:hypothetical protein
MAGEYFTEKVAAFQTLAAASGALLMAPVALPAIVTSIAAYIAVAGSVATAISQVTVEGVN